MTKLVGEKVRTRIWIGVGDRYGDKLLNDDAHAKSLSLTKV
jgi:hypothetical protein